jgi:hypothetical protein
MRFPVTRVLVLVILVGAFVAINAMDDQRVLREIGQYFFRIDSPLAGLIPSAAVFVLITVAFFTKFGELPQTEED